MKISLHALCVGTFVPMLTSLAGLLDKAAEHAKAKNFDPSILVKARLAPDMFPLWLQVRIACRQASGAVALLTGGSLPPFDMREVPLEELKALAEQTAAEIKAVRAEAFEGADDRDIVMPMPPTTMILEVDGSQLVIDWALPHFYFHVVTVYDILRHNGVEIGKRDYLSHIGGFIRDKG